MHAQIEDDRVIPPAFPLRVLYCFQPRVIGHETSRLTASITVGVSGASYESCRAIALTVLLCTHVLLHLAVVVITYFLECTSKVIPTSL